MLINNLKDHKMKKSLIDAEQLKLKHYNEQNAQVEQVGQPIAKPHVICRLSNTRTGETEVYKEATYTKLDGVYGYICVDGLAVKFFYSYEGQVCCDQIMYLIVSYELS